MTIRTILAWLAILASTQSCARVQAQKETDWKAPLGEGGAPGCPDHIGSRTLRSETVSLGLVKVFILGTTERAQNRTCHSKADLVISGRVQGTIPLLGAGGPGFSIIDFSPDGRNVLIGSYHLTGPPYENYRNESIAVVGLATRAINWVNVWDLFRWEHCEATVEPQGFKGDGSVLLLARPSDLNPPSKNDCVKEWGLYAADLNRPPIRLPDDTKVPRFGKVVAEQEEVCKTDPDIIGACFTVHGRLSFWNGGPSARIWRVGTKRILGDHDDWPLPEKLADHMNWETEAWGDFEVCPFTKERPGGMQMVCVESARNVIYKAR